MRRFTDDDRGFTPLAGSGLLIGVVVLLLAVVGAAMFGFIDAVAPPDAEFEITTDDGEVVIHHLEGDPIPAEELFVHGEDPDETVQFGGWPTDGIVRPGDRITVEAATGNERIEVVWEPVAFARTETLAERDPDDADVAGWEKGNGLGTDPLA